MDEGILLQKIKIKINNDEMDHTLNPKKELSENSRHMRDKSRNRREN